MTMLVLGYMMVVAQGIEQEQALEEVSPFDGRLVSFRLYDFDMWCMLFKHDFGDNGMSGSHRDESSIGLATKEPEIHVGYPTSATVDSLQIPQFGKPVLYSRQSSEAGQYYADTCNVLLRLEAFGLTFNLDVEEERKEKRIKSIAARSGKLLE